MGRLSAPPALVAKLQPTITQSPQDEKQRSRYRDRTQHWRAWYKLKRWTDLRWRVLTRDLFTCRMCGRIEGNTSRLVCDHRAPHHGDPALFWDEANLQTLCSPCHDSAKQREERSYRT
jgi:5-methylcytosine-specific restriction protein A